MNRRGFLGAMSAVAGSVAIGWKEVAAGIEPDLTEVTEEPVVSTESGASETKVLVKFKNLDLHYLIGILGTYKRKIMENVSFQQGIPNKGLNKFIEDELVSIVGIIHEAYSSPSFTAPQNIHEHYTEIDKARNMIDGHANKELAVIDTIDQLINEIPKFKSANQSCGITHDEMIGIISSLDIIGATARRLI